VSRDPFDDIVHALGGNASGAASPGVRIDPGRAARTGIPEVVLAERKQPGDLATSLAGLARAQGRAIASRVRPDQVEALLGALGDEFNLVVDEMSRVAIASKPESVPPTTGGRVAVICAGSSDRPIAREAAIMATEMGCEVREVADVGVAGLHRLVMPLRDVMAWKPHVIVAAAGMDGAMPSVIAGLVPVPVIGLPVSVGYGYGGDGTAALMSMLQSCAPGLAVVNIDNGIGAGSMAALIANNAACTD
jgi:NCAIR mutase (PurE)-related protein